jgi:hypothetical protein
MGVRDYSISILVNSPKTENPCRIEPVHVDRDFFEQ